MQCFLPGHRSMQTLFAPPKAMFFQMTSQIESKLLEFLDSLSTRHFMKLRHVNNFANETFSKQNSLQYAKLSVKLMHTNQTKFITTAEDRWLSWWVGKYNRIFKFTLSNFIFNLINLLLQKDFNKSVLALAETSTVRHTTHDARGSPLTIPHLALCARWAKNFR